MIALRTVEGINLTDIEIRFGLTVSEQLLLRSKKYSDGNLIILQNNALVLTKEGKFLADGIAGDLFV